MLIHNLSVIAIHKDSCWCCSLTWSDPRSCHNVQDSLHVKVGQQGLSGASLYKCCHTITGLSANTVQGHIGAVGETKDRWPLSWRSPGWILSWELVRRPVGLESDLVESSSARITGGPHNSSIGSNQKQGQECCHLEVYSVLNISLSLLDEEDWRCWHVDNQSTTDPQTECPHHYTTTITRTRNTKVWILNHQEWK